MHFFQFILWSIALSIPVMGIVLSHVRKMKNIKIRELEIKKEILELEIKQQDNRIKLLESECRKYDDLIFENQPK